MKFLLPWGHMLTKTKNIRKKVQKSFFFLQKFKKCLGIWPRESKNQNLKAIHAIGSQIIDATDGRTDDGRTKNEFRFSRAKNK